MKRGISFAPVGWNRTAATTRDVAKIKQAL
jgi:hypothetical protein